jgi:hypothetical protein
MSDPSALPGTGAGTGPIPGAGPAGMPVIPKFDNTLGALLLGGLVAMG